MGGLVVGGLLLAYAASSTNIFNDNPAATIASPAIVVGPTLAGLLVNSAITRWERVWERPADPARIPGVWP